MTRFIDDAIGWCQEHPNVVVFACALIMVQAISNFDRAVEWKASLRRDLDKAISESLGGLSLNP